MTGLDASIAISATHAATRAALQEALPHLHELFQGSGLQLTGAHVGDGSQRHADQGAAQRNAAAATSRSGSSEATAAASAPLAIGVGQAAGGSRLIDTFA
jgi:flagellar hook-length control protein FliK